MTGQLVGGPNDGLEVTTENRWVECAVVCGGALVCRAVYERAGDAFVFKGIGHLFHDGDGYKSVMERADEWEARQREGREFAPVGLVL